MLFIGAREAFNLLDLKKNNRIKVGEIKAGLQKLGHNIKPDWLEKMESTIDIEGCT